MVLSTPRAPSSGHASIRNSSACSTLQTSRTCRPFQGKGALDGRNHNVFLAIDEVTHAEISLPRLLFFIFADLPDSVTTSAVSLAVNATGAVSFKTIVLITPEEADAAVKKSVSYRPSGR
jgi:hypothetical protein